MVLSPVQKSQRNEKEKTIDKMTIQNVEFKTSICVFSVNLVCKEELNLMLVKLVKVRWV